ncbi:MAG: hypothetical protein EAZ91_20980 [Cytophagales bacterium]|nr:MAG: hypothetical protein EAZ91_20980 [Cytophagales bacterium]
MQVQNRKEINRAFGRFLGWFAALTGLLLACAYAFLQTGAYQVTRLTEQRQHFEEIFLLDAVLAEKVDTLYTNMVLLNTNRVLNERQLERVITKDKEEISKIVTQNQKMQGYFGVYGRLSGHINEMLVLKDSLNKAIADETIARTELTDCLNYNRRKR